jgi:sulfur-oxidizing protein SoxZ
MARKPRVKVPKSAKKGDVILIKTLAPHKMETGQRKNKKTGKKIPRLIINKFDVTFNGKEVVSADLHPAIAANPYLAFNYRVVESGTFKFVWTDDKGKTVTVEKSLKAG